MTSWFNEVPLFYKLCIQLKVYFTLSPTPMLEQVEGISSEQATTGAVYL